VLAVDRDRIDAWRFERLLSDAKRATGEERCTLLDEALSLWRGEPLSDVDRDRLGDGELVRLHELRLGAVEDRFDVELGRGRDIELIPEIEALVSAHPLRERLWGQLMLALYRSGRQGDALHACQQARRRLSEELGIDPGPALRRLEMRILQQDPELEPPRREPAQRVDHPASPGTAQPMVVERKFATALFADVVGAPALTEREDPEVVQALLRRTFDRLTQAVTAHGGGVENLTGDGLRAVFGIPAAHEDDSERAVRAALEMVSDLDRLGRDLVREGRTQLSLRIGVEAGEVVVGTAMRGHRTITGDALSTASGLQGSADPGCVLVGPVAHELTKGSIDYRRLAPLRLEGRAEPVQAWLALRITGSPPAHRSPVGLGSRLIGRDAELSLLTSTLGRVIAESRPALVTVLGPAGVGKSRLVLEFLSVVEGSPRGIACLRGRCRAYGNVSYSAVAEAVRAHCGILEDDPPGVAAEKAGRAVEELFGDRSLAHHVEALVGAGSERTFTREDLFDGWRRMLERIAAVQPLVLVLEDIHWADEGLLDFVEHLADWGEGRILVLTLARPELMERRAGWGGGKRNYAAVYLDPLTREETAELLSDLLSARLSTALSGLVFDRGEGNPLFSEQIVRMLIDRGVIRAAAPGQWEVSTSIGEIEVPRSIHALIAARLDALPPSEKAVLQTAAVVGRIFWLGAAERLSGLGEQETRHALGRLRLKELIVHREPSAMSGESEYGFRHVLIRDVAYESLAKSLRAEKHLEVARWAEEQAGERRDEIAELLATHYVESLRYLDQLRRTDGGRAAVERQAYAWARSAGERALRLWEQRDAVRWFRTALRLSTQVAPPSLELGALWESTARAGEDVEPYAEVGAALEQALALYEEMGCQREAGRVEARLAYVAHQQGDHASVVVTATRALERLEPLGDTSDLALALHVLGWHEFRTTRYALAEQHLRRAIGIAERAGDRTVWGQAMVSLAFVFQQTGRGEECVALFEDALTLARTAGDLSLLLRALTHICGALEEFRGDYRRAEGYAREGLELARRAGSMGNVGWTAQMLSDMLVEMGRLDEAESAIEEALTAARTVGDTLVVGYGLQRVAYLRALRAQPEAAHEALTAARSMMGSNPEPWLAGWDPLIAGHIAQGRGDDEEAARLLTEGARPQVTHLFVWGGKSLLLECVRVLVKLGRGGEALQFRDRLSALASASVPARAFLAWADGLLATSRRGCRQQLADAAVQLLNLQHVMEHGRCLGDLSDAESREGLDATATRERSREALESCGASLFLRDLGCAAERP
jgi:class 3 adenylate cyclase/tetratricopeptide (TPR) repeat protein